MMGKTTLNFGVFVIMVCVLSVYGCGDLNPQPVKPEEQSKSEGPALEQTSSHWEPGDSIIDGIYMFPHYANPDITHLILVFPGKPARLFRNLWKNRRNNLFKNPVHFMCENMIPYSFCVKQISLAYILHVLLSGNRGYEVLTIDTL